MSSTNTNFFLTKYYADVIDSETNNLLIVYSGHIKWHAFKIHFSNILQFMNKSEEQKSFLRFNNCDDEWKHDNDEIRLKSDYLNGTWRAMDNELCEIMLENSDGYIKWECMMPLANSNVQLCKTEKSFNGLGYIERLTCTIEPWKIPIDNLKWGRFLNEFHYVVWIWWTGDTNKSLIFYNNKKFTNGIVTDNELIFEEYRLALDEKHEIRKGAIGNTVFKDRSMFRTMFNRSIFKLNECKWQTKSYLFKNNTKIAEGWSIHETVDWTPVKFLIKIQKLMYGSFFMLILPVLFVLLTVKTEPYVTLDIPNTAYNSIIGIFLAVIGLISMILSMTYLWIHGKGLPMNAFPPKKLVTCGPYKLVSHPIYVSSTMISLGISLYFESKSGFWLVTPVLTLLWLALVYGFEEGNINQLFPSEQVKPLIDLPENINENIQIKDLISSYILLVIPWALIYSYFNSKMSLIYIMIVFTSIFIRKKSIMRSFLIDGLLMMMFQLMLQSFVLIDYLRELIPADSNMLLFKTSWILLSFKYNPFSCYNNTSFNYYAAIITIITTLLLKNSFLDIIDSILAFCIFSFIQNKQFIWLNVKSVLQILANSWSCYMIGYLRIINHAIYIVFGMFFSIYLSSVMVDDFRPMIMINFFVIISGAIWGQFVEGHVSSLSRPYGYFGSSIGGLVGCVVSCYIYNIPFILISTALALVSAFIMIFGRIRCLVQGCCHGKQASEYVGIRVTNLKSRVCALANLYDQPIHATQFYSIISHVLIALFLTKLCYLKVNLLFIPSLYLILQGVTRFIEEYYRGEPQTPIFSKLKLYQWLSILQIFTGILFMFLPNNENIQFKWNYRSNFILPSLISSLITGVAYCVDFPLSNWRFSRLSNK